MPTRKPASARRQAAPAVASDLLDDLREIYKNLDAIDTKTMSPAQQQEWFDQYTKTRQAIMVLETQSLAAINKQLGNIADSVTRAIDDCEKTLHGVQDAAVVMQTVAAALTAIAKIAVLLA
jgi:pyruvate/2-oxoglutarate/acetoin dehydrogenase E1 component